MGKTSSKVKNRYNAKHYDNLRIIVPKGRRADVDAYAKANGMSVNGLVNELLRERLGMSETDWKKKEEPENAGE